MPMTLDTGARVTLVPRKYILENCLTGVNMTFNGADATKGTSEGEAAEIAVTVGGVTRKETTVAVPGKRIRWIGMLSVNLRDEKDLEMIANAKKERDEKGKRADEYIPPVVEGNRVIGAIWPVGVELDSETPVVPSGSEPERKEEMSREAEVTILVDEQKGLVEGEAESQEKEERAVETEGEQVEKQSKRENIGLETERDETLKTVRKLAKKKERGYVKDKSGVIFRHRIDDIGWNVKQACLPLPFRVRCLEAAHERFGHQGRNKMVEHISRSFYWPTMWKDAADHCSRCEACQRNSKLNPKPSPLIEREVVTVPTDRVCVDLVGPLPKAKGGEYLLTNIDVATRWPEAIPLKSTISHGD